MSDAQRRTVTTQARRCISSSLEECEEALRLESLPMSKTERQKLKRHFFAACPEMQFLDVIELFSTPKIAPMVSTNSMSLDLTSGWIFFSHEDRIKAWRYICYFKHIVVILSSECKGFSNVMNANWKKMSADHIEYVQDTCFAMLLFFIQVAIHQDAH